MIKICYVHRRKVTYPNSSSQCGATISICTIQVMHLHFDSHQFYSLLADTWFPAGYLTLATTATTNLLPTPHLSNMHMHSTYTVDGAKIFMSHKKHQSSSFAVTLTCTPGCCTGADVLNYQPFFVHIHKQAPLKPQRRPQILLHY